MINWKDNNLKSVSSESRMNFTVNENTIFKLTCYKGKQYPTTKSLNIVIDKPKKVKYAWLADVINDLDCNANFIDFVRAVNKMVILYLTVIA